MDIRNSDTRKSLYLHKIMLTILNWVKYRIIKYKIKIILHIINIILLSNGSVIYKIKPQYNGIAM